MPDAELWPESEFFLSFSSIGIDMGRSSANGERLPPCLTSQPGHRIDLRRREEDVGMEWDAPRRRSVKAMQD
jgi:hypothetical protein